ncbi:DUF5133 domain-containing protein [Yinghuangia sp. YIM S09857]|uniref:DUF5133 domain-containing protein n=1 Tax=Yinghuangia sp. YIM S09857 TaxID=3436929 RepID=UPI003F537D4C
MLLAHPAVLAGLVERYEAMVLLHAENGTGEARRRTGDLAYTLCTATGTSDVDAALIAARHHLPGARPGDDSVVPARRPQEEVPPWDSRARRTN